MQLLVLGATESWYVRDLRRAAGTKHEILPLPFRALAADVVGGDLRVSSLEHRLDQCDAVLVRTMPAGSLEQVVFRMDVLGQLAERGVLVVNPPKAVEAAVDKYLTTSRLAAAGLQVPETYVCQTCDQAVQAFARMGGDVVVKPVFGSEGRGIARINDEAVAWRTFRLLEQLGAVIYLQQMIAHGGADWRLLVIGQHVLGMTRSNTGDWRTNVSRGAQAEPLEVTPELADLAQRAARAVGAVLAGVDVLPGPHGEHIVLEVNAVPGWRALADTLSVDVAQLVLEYLESATSPALGD